MTTKHDIKTFWKFLVAISKSEGYIAWITSDSESWYAELKHSGGLSATLSSGVLKIVIEHFYSSDVVIFEESGSIPDLKKKIDEMFFLQYKGRKIKKQ